MDRLIAEYLMYKKFQGDLPIISLSPSITRTNSLAEIFPILLPIRSTDKVLIWLILTHDFFGRSVDSIGRGSGKSAFGGWLVSSDAITVPDRALKISCLRTRTGRRPDCSFPRVGFISAHRISPLTLSISGHVSISLVIPAYAS